jgi:hypothetical protein
MSRFSRTCWLVARIVVLPACAGMSTRPEYETATPSAAASCGGHGDTAVRLPGSARALSERCLPSR